MNEKRLGSLIRMLLVSIISLGLFFSLNYTLKVINLPDGEAIRWMVPSNEIAKYYQFEKPNSKEFVGYFSYNGVRNTIVFQKVIATKLEIFVNRERVAVFGDGTGNLWPKALTIVVPERVLRKSEKNEIKVVLHGIVGVGLSGSPYLVDMNTAIQRAQLINLFRDDIVLVGVGAAAVILYLFLLAYTGASANEKRSYFYILMASIFMILGLVQFTYRETYGSVENYLIFEELAQTTPMFVVTFLLLLIFENSGFYLKKRFKILFFIVPFLLTGLVIVSTNTKYMHLFGVLSELYSMILVIYVSFLVYVKQLVEYVFPVSFLLFAGIQTFYVLASGLPNELMIPYGRLVFLISLATTTLTKFKHIAARHEILVKENVIDQLTGAFNRKVIEQLPKGGVLILIDIDGLKKVNDTYGHIYGDKLLQRFSEIVKSSIRHEDYFIRLGGDEFCIVSGSITEKDVERVMSRLYNHCRNELGIGFSYGFAPFDNFDKAYEQADKMMYQMKEEKYRSK
ncbi:MAG: GGDEF domain-containing protein [Fervidobacterium sp.]|uniref:GGDEF domain-containing protein n=1 Tax=Fervidobacterium sp. TaxID=1871331 RepID=UPI0040490212